MFLKDGGEKSVEEDEKVIVCGVVIFWLNAKRMICVFTNRTTRREIEVIVLDDISLVGLANMYCIT